MTLTYGLPGKPGYSYARPFDYFDFHVSAATANTLETITSRGLLAGRPTHPGTQPAESGGLFGSYDYIRRRSSGSPAPPLTGNRGQSWLADELALQGTFLGGAGYGAASIQRTEERDYHYGTTPQALLAPPDLCESRHAGYHGTGILRHFLSPNDMGRKILSGRIFIDASPCSTGTAWRFAILSHRDAHYPSVEFRNQTVTAVSLMYVILGDSGFGAVEWR